jgi:hypothetical protein
MAQVANNAATSAWKPKPLAAALPPVCCNRMGNGFGWSFGSSGDVTTGARES